MDDQTRWLAVAARDASADGKFIYAVKTTGIFCRPVCKARLARRTNVVFFDDAAAARAAGYRACKRCRPELDAAFANPEADRIARVCALLRARGPGAPEPSLQSLAAAAGLTKFHFHRLFKRETGLTPRAFVRAASQGRMRDRPYLKPGSGSLAASPKRCKPLNLDDVSDGYLGTAVAEVPSPAACAILPIESGDRLDLQPEDLTISYSITSTAYGRSIVALQDGRLCWADSDFDDGELMQRFEAVFPSDIYVHMLSGSVGDQQDFYPLS